MENKYDRWPVSRSEITVYAGIGQGDYKVFVTQHYQVLMYIIVVLLLCYNEDEDTDDMSMDTIDDTENSTQNSTCTLNSLI